MNPIEIVGGILLIIASLLIILIIMLQESKQAGMGAISGESGSNNFYSRESGRTKDAFYARLTKVLAVVFFVVTIIINIVIQLVN